MKITVDRLTNTAYIRLRDANVARTIELRGDVYVDVDDQGNVIGVELLDANAYFERDHLELTIPDNIQEIDGGLVIG